MGNANAATIVATVSSVCLAWLAASWLVAAPVMAQMPGVLSVLVTGVESGEVLDIRYDGHPARLRLIGVAVPSCMIGDAGRRVDVVARGRVALLEMDSVTLDSANEVLGYLWIDEVMLNIRLVSEGYAVFDSDGMNVRYDPEFLAAGNVASRGRYGLWARSDCR
jgi:endonuclease YncB( thermonuclease family)